MSNGLTFNIKILITGFEPNDNGLNASEILVLSLQDKLPDVLSGCPHTLNFKIMPGDTERLGSTIDDVLKIDSPDI
ncbi:MAG: hypothetical protein AAGF66_15455 [Cyanobacteria bacterium P01_H01_bin.119]